eukprot:TRINITY_DN1223_c0_g1_i1.p1 TRINITY_DN1223_c0_g1~~TRINITY_DN1223_c0_g1_i1.p1  ORF type:complete len:392 (-),score=7.74 TRINITY_DN1223_c0_g1_i1:2081-3256(-)
MQNSFNTPSSSPMFTTSLSTSPQSNSPPEILLQASNRDIANLGLPIGSNEQSLTDILTQILLDPNTDLQKIEQVAQILAECQRLNQQQQQTHPASQNLSSQVRNQVYPPTLYQQGPVQQHICTNPQRYYPFVHVTYTNSPLLNRVRQIQLQQLMGGTPPVAQQPRLRSNRTSRLQAQNRHLIERTIYVTELVHNITEEEVATFFNRCGVVEDCRVTNNPYSHTRRAYIQFSESTFRSAVPIALNLHNPTLRGKPMCIQKSTTPIIPISEDLFPKTLEEDLRCRRTLCVHNIERRFTQQDVKVFFENLAADRSVGADGKVARVKMMPDNSEQGMTQMALLEFYSDESVGCALDKSLDVCMGRLPLRICASKIPIRTPEEDRILRETIARRTY